MTAQDAGPNDVSPTDGITSQNATRQAYNKLRDQVGQVIVGQSEVVEQLLLCLFCQGHALLVGVPGLAKTLLVSTIAQAMDLPFNRIQFTPDLMPSDITGTDVIEEDRTTGKRHLRFVKGPIFASVILADEINRTPPKTQAALLEAMQEQHVTAGGQRHPLPQPFFVLATQNPIEQEGTYPLPEAQLDRFMFMINVGYPTHEEEAQIVRTTTTGSTSDVTAQITAEQITAIRSSVLDVPVADHVIGYALRLVRATRTDKSTNNDNDDAIQTIRRYLAWGAGPRASQYLVLAGKARALLDGRTHVTIQDIQSIAHPVLRHRLITNFNAEADGVGVDDLIDRLLDTIPMDDADPATRRQMDRVLK